MIQTWMCVSKIFLYSLNIVTQHVPLLATALCPHISQLCETKLHQASDPAPAARQNARSGPDTPCSQHSPADVEAGGTFLGNPTAAPGASPASLAVEGGNEESSTSPGVQAPSKYEVSIAAYGIDPLTVEFLSHSSADWTDMFGLARRHTRADIGSPLQRRNFPSSVWPAEQNSLRLAFGPELTDESWLLATST